MNRLISVRSPPSVMNDNSAACEMRRMPNRRTSVALPRLAIAMPVAITANATASHSPMPYTVSTICWMDTMKPNSAPKNSVTASV